MTKPADTTVRPSQRSQPKARSQRCLARATPVSEAERARLRELHGAGLSCGQIAREMSRDRATISRHARALGLSFARDQTKNATEARVIDAAAKRAEISLQFLQLTERINAKVLALLDDPEAEVKPWGLRDYSYASGAFFDRHLAQAQLDKPTDGDYSIVDRWLEAMTGSSHPPAPGALPADVTRPQPTPADKNLPAPDQLPDGLQPWRQGDPWPSERKQP